MQIPFPNKPILFKFLFVKEGNVMQNAVNSSWVSKIQNNRFQVISASIHSAFSGMAVQ